MRYLSVCSGIEAATVAWHPLGWTAAGFAEIDTFPCHVLWRRFGATRPRAMPDPDDAPDDRERRARAAAIKGVASIPADGSIPNYGDFTTIEASDVGATDLLVGGTPCQDFSIAGAGAGLDAARGRLTLEFARLAARTRPRWLVWENVPGVFSNNEGADFGNVIGCFAGYDEPFAVPPGGWKNAGIVPPAGPDCYGLAWRVLDAQYFGVPQRRRRVFVVGYSGDWRPAAAVLLEPESLRGDPPPCREAGKDASHSLRTCLKASHRDDSDNYVPQISPALKARDSKGPSSDGDGDGAPLIAQSQRAEGLDASEVGVRIAVRRLTPREFERLQGFPDDYTLIPYRGRAADLCPDGPRYKAIGNSMAVPVMAWIGRRIDEFQRVMRIADVNVPDRARPRHIADILPDVIDRLARKMEDKDALPADERV